MRTQCLPGLLSHRGRGLGTRLGLAVYEIDSDSAVYLEHVVGNPCYYPWYNAFNMKILRFMIYAIIKEEKVVLNAINTTCTHVVCFQKATCQEVPIRTHSSTTLTVGVVSSVLVVRT